MKESTKVILKECLTKSSKSHSKVFLAGDGEWMELDAEKRAAFENMNIGDYYLDYMFCHVLVDEKIQDHCAVAYHISDKLIDENGNLILIYDEVEKTSFA